MIDCKIEIDFATIPFTERQKKKLQRILLDKVDHWYRQSIKREAKEWRKKNLPR